MIDDNSEKVIDHFENVIVFDSLHGVKDDVQVCVQQMDFFCCLNES